MTRITDCLNLTYTDLEAWAYADGALGGLIDDGDYGRPSDLAGVLAAAAYTKSGPHNAAQVLQEHLKGRNMAAAKLGWPQTSQVKLRDRFGTAIGDHLTTEQKQEIHALL